LNPYLFATRWPELKAQNYPNTLENFVRLTISSGRPAPSVYWADEAFTDAMPTWSNRFGGPLRDDQIEYLAAYILSWEESIGAVSTPVPFEAVGADLTIELPAGDAARGQQLFDQVVNLANGRPAPCKACHSLDGSVLLGPSLQGIAGRAGGTVSGQDAATYIRHSIQAPDEYLVPGATFVSAAGNSLMPAGLGDTMSAQDLADLIAFLLTQ
jgi:cytochrome c2